MLGGLWAKKATLLLVDAVPRYDANLEDLRNGEQELCKLFRLEGVARQVNDPNPAALRQGSQPGSEELRCGHGTAEHDGSIAEGTSHDNSLSSMFSEEANVSCAKSVQPENWDMFIDWHRVFPDENVANDPLVLCRCSPSSL